MTSTNERLSQALNQALEILEPLRTIPSLYEELQTLLSDSASSRMRIGVVGVTSSGKSTFINGLLGESLLPEDSVATTNIPVICRYGTRRKVTVCYEAEANADAVEYYDDDVTTSLLKGLCSEEGNRFNSKLVRRVELELPSCCLPPELEIIDTPGTDAQGLPGHEAITLYRCLPLADIIVFMTNIQRRIQESEAKLLRNVIDHDQRVLFVMARRDTERADWQGGKMILSKEEKLRNREIKLAETLAQFDKLRDCGVFSVSSVLAKQARGDRSSNVWQESKFEAVVACFDKYAKDLEQLLASSRIERTRAILESVSRRIKATEPELTEEFETTTEAAYETADRSARQEQEMRAAVESVRQTTTEAFDPASWQLEASAELGGMPETDIAGVIDTLKRLGNGWKKRVKSEQGRIDALRHALRENLALLKLETGRSELQHKTLHLDPVPDANARIKHRTWSERVEVPRTYWCGSLVDAIFGTRAETQYHTESYIDMPSFKRDMTLFLRQSAEMFRESAAEQCDLLLELYVEPVRREKERVEERYRALAERAEVDWLPLIVQQLKEIHETFFSRAETAASRDDRGRGPAATAENEEQRRQHRSKTERKPINDLIAKLWESIAIQRFFCTARRAAGVEVLEEILLLGPADNVHSLQAFLIRSSRQRDFSSKAEPDENRSESYVVTRPSGQIRVSTFHANGASSQLIEAACRSADAIGVAFEAGQPSLGMRLLLKAPFFQYAAQFPHKVFYFYGDGAVFDTRLADLVTQVAPTVARASGFGDRPWFIYDAATYDARYSDFLELSSEVKRNGGSDRELMHLWRQKQISMHQPFHKEALARAFALISVGDTTTND